jgi:hypothetical protein
MNAEGFGDFSELDAGTHFLADRGAIGVDAIRITVAARQDEQQQ